MVWKDSWEFLIDEEDNILKSDDFISIQGVEVGIIGPEVQRLMGTNIYRCFGNNINIIFNDNERILAFMLLCLHVGDPYFGSSIIEVGGKKYDIKIEDNGSFLKYEYLWELIKKDFKKTNNVAIISDNIEYSRNILFYIIDRDHDDDYWLQETMNYWK